MCNVDPLNANMSLFFHHKRAAGYGFCFWVWIYLMVRYIYWIEFTLLLSTVAYHIQCMANDTFPFGKINIIINYVEREREYLDLFFIVEALKAWDHTMHNKYMYILLYIMLWWMVEVGHYSCTWLSRTTVVKYPLTMPRTPYKAKRGQISHWNKRPPIYKNEMALKSSI